jgi:hypothetical protein
MTIKHIIETFTFLKVHTEKPYIAKEGEEEYTVWLKIGVQQFQIGGMPFEEEEAEWMRLQLAKALLNFMEGK